MSGSSPIFLKNGMTAFAFVEVDGYGNVLNNPGGISTTGPPGPPGPPGTGNPLLIKAGPFVLSDFMDGQAVVGFDSINNTYRTYARNGTTVMASALSPFIVPPPPPPIGTWSLTDKSSLITLSNSNNTATRIAPGGTDQLVRGNLGRSTGKWHLEFTFVTGATNSAVGLATELEALYNYLGHFDGASVGIGNDYIPPTTCLVFIPGPDLDIGAANIIVNGLVYAIEVNLDTKLFWAAEAISGIWNGNVLANPVTGIGGIDISYLVGDLVYPAADPYDLNDQITVNTTGAFVRTPSAGFSAWG